MICALQQSNKFELFNQLTGNKFVGKISYFLKGLMLFLTAKKAINQLLVIDYKLCLASIFYDFKILFDDKLTLYVKRCFFNVKM